MTTMHWHRGRSVCKQVLCAADDCIMLKGAMMTTSSATATRCMKNGQSMISNMCVETYL